LISFAKKDIVKRMKKLSIIIPAYNEEKTLAHIVKKVQTTSVLPLEKEIIIVNNASFDTTLDIATDLEKNNPEIKAFSTEKNKGKGQAVKLGFKKATGDILIIQDADLEYDPADYRAVIQPILDGRTTVTNGVRIENRLRESKSALFP
jgi:dolichol-phosphate mannosyltransferase